MKDRQGVKKRAPGEICTFIVMLLVNHLIYALPVDLFR
jgi:hypothetical protein